MFGRPRLRAIGIASALAMLSAGLVVGANPAAADPPNELNSGGGTSAIDGLHIYSDSDQIQVKRMGLSQLSGIDQLPLSSGVNANLSNGIYLLVGSTLIGPQTNATVGATVTSRVPWDSVATTNSGTGISGGTLTSTMTWTTGGLVYTVVRALQYLSLTDNRIHETITVTVPSGNPGIVKLYETMDTLAGGHETGVGYYNPNGSQPTVGVTTSDGSGEAIRYIDDPRPWTGYWSGQNSCMYVDNCQTLGDLGYLNRGADFPSPPTATSLNTDPSTNNGIGVDIDLSMAGVAPPNTYTFSHDIIFIAAQAITFPQPVGGLVGGAEVMGASSNSTLWITYSSATPEICSVGPAAPGPNSAGALHAATVDTSRITFLRAGVCTINADQAGSVGFAPAATMPRSFNISAPVPPPAAPTPASLTSTGPGGASQSATVVLATGNTVTLLDGGQPASSVTVAGVGTYTVNSTTGVITFTPVAGYSGTPASVTFRVTDSGARFGTATYTPTVTVPAAPTPGARISTGPGTQHATVPLGIGETLTLLDATGVPASSVTKDGEGTYSADAASGVITFTPVAGFQGAASGVGFRVTDGYAQTGDSTYTPTVKAEVVPPPVKPLPVIDRSKQVKIPSDPEAVKGKEKKTKAFDSSFNGTDANPITKLGKRKLVKGEAATLDGDGLFGFDSGKLTASGRAQVKAVVFNLKGSKTVHCEGYTDYAGDRSHEIDLSLRRAKAVCAALKAYGAKVTTMTRGYGPKRPAVVGGTAKARKENRRVVVLITK
jgi:CshA-type fibril repeat protein